MIRLALRALLVGWLLLLLAIAASPAAWEEPDNFRGVPWGMSMREAQALLESKGEKPDCSSRRFCFTFRTSIGPTLARISYVFEDDKFTSALLTFAPTQYEALRTIFSDRYGPPTSIRDEELKTRMGAAYLNQISTWAGDKVVIRLRRYSSKIDEGSALIALKEALDKRREETEKAIKKGKDDL